MEIWSDKKKCTGCGACSNICPKKAIKMIADENGFLYPQIDETLCINCGLCKKTCPVLENKNKNTLEPTAYAGWSRDEENRNKSTSGGIFFELGKIILQENGYVVGAKYNAQNLVEHAITNTIEGLNELRQSKYVQSNTKDIFKEVKKRLDEGYKIGFAGSPCQVAALYNFLKKDYENLLTIEFICRGMNSPKAYEAWLKEIESNENKKVCKVWFKYKSNGWKESPRCTRVDFEDGSFKVIDGKKNLYMLGYLEDNLYIRPSCGECHFNGLPRQADITLADFWGIEKELDDDKGTSLILVNSKLGEEYVQKLEERIQIFKKDVSDIYKGNVCFNNSVTINPKSAEFLKGLDEEAFSTRLKKFHKKKPIYKRVLGKIKRIVKKILGK